MSKAKKKLTPLTIKTLPLNLKAELDSFQRRSLVELIDNAFRRKAERRSSENNEKREIFMKQYRENSGFNLLSEDLVSLRAKVTNTLNKINLLGLDADGNLLSYYGNPDSSDPKILAASKRMHERVDSLVDETYDFDSELMKIKTRILLATTVEEAIVIVREVIGNGIIPSLPAPDAGSEAQKG